ncbi:RNA dependent RNA polymerase-domain-containing protein [Russula compacta]|nr:RNA dependent RNA polymerase-domain-containing protein [Russula compacta]
MEIDIKAIDIGADIYDVRKAVELVLHGPDLYDPNDPKHKGRKPNFEVILNESPAGRIHNGTGILRVPITVGNRLFQWIGGSDKNKIVINGRALRLYRTSRKVLPAEKQKLDKVLYVGPEREKKRKVIESQAREARLRIAKLQFGVWHRPPNSPQNHGRAFSIEYEREFVSKGEAYISVVYEYKLIRIDIGQRETEEINYMILVKFSSIHKLGIGNDECGQPFIVFDLRVPPIFEGKGFNDWEAPRDKRHKNRHNNLKTRDRLLALDDAHSRIAPYAHHLRVVLFEPDADSFRFFSHRNLYQVERWIKTMDWKIAFQVESYLRGALLTPHDLFFSLRNAIEDVIRDYGSDASELLRTFTLALQTRRVAETPSSCLARVRAEHPAVKPLQLSPGHILCHHVIITPTRMLLEGPYATQSNRVIRRYQDHDPALAERFLRVEFCDEDHLAYRWDREVDGSWFVQRRVGGVLRDGLEVAGRPFEFLAYSTSALRQHAVWFVSPFHDPVEGDVNAESIRAQLGDFSSLLRTPSKYAARIAQAFTSTDPSVKIRCDQWEEQEDLGPHTDGVGTISQELADMIWEEHCRATGNLRENRVRPSAYQFRFLGYKGVVVVDNRLQGIKMRLRESQRKFPVHNVEEAEFEIAQIFNSPIPVHLNRPIVMILEDRGVKKEALIELQDAAKRKFTSRGIHWTCSEQLYALGLDFKKNSERRAIECAFLERLLRYSMNYSLREVKFKARIPVPNSYQLVGVADEGQAYIREGANPENVFTLGEGRIYACVQESLDEDPIYLKGKCVLSRSPVIHPGDIQIVHAVGKPPDDKICFFHGLKNVVVLPAVGDHSLASCLAGGDLDGDPYDIYYQNPALLPGIQENPADYPPGEVWTLDENHGDATIEDVCRFIVEYINSDVMGLLANRHMVIADQSKDGVFDKHCMDIAKLYSQAVDYAKNGVPVDISNNFPRPLIKFKPDWEKAEVTGARELDYYESDRALGHLFRNIHLDDPNEALEGPSDTSPEPTAPLEDMISRAIAPLIKRTLDDTIETPEAENIQAKELHARFVREMRYICMSHALLDSPDVHLTEEEADRTYRMKLHVETLVRDIRARIAPADEGQRTDKDFRGGLQNAWATWGWAQHHRDKEYIESFSLIALGVILDCLGKLGALPNH